MIESYNDVTQKALFLGKWIRILFWIIIPITLADLMTINIVALRFPLLYLIGLILKFVCPIVYGLIILKMSSENGHYHTSGLCYLVVAVINVIAAFSPSRDMQALLILTLPATVIGLVAKYHEFRGHAEVLCDVDADLSEKWIILWKRYISIIGIMLGCSILMMIAPIIGSLLLFVAAIGMIVVSVLQLVYLYKSGKAFREYTT